jgi:hypothetical protein
LWYSLFQGFRKAKGRTLRVTLKSLPGVALSVCAAVALSLLLNDDSEIRLLVPVICLFVVLATSFIWGRMAAILGSVGATLTFTILLFPPLGSLRVADPGERMMLLLFQLSAIGLAFLAPRRLPIPIMTKKASGLARIGQAWPADVKASKMADNSSGTNGSRSVSGSALSEFHPSDFPEPKT